MADQIPWLDGQANVPGSVEKICPKRHIRQNQWQSEWNGEYHKVDPGYDYISDYECIFNHPIDNETQLESYPILWPDLKKAKKQGTRLSITNLAHFTKKEKAIVASGGFKGGIKKINLDEEGNNVSPKFSWWSPKFDENDRTTVQSTLEKAITPFLTDEDDITNLKSQFATSVAFLPNSQSLTRYGSYYFQYGINDLCEHYGSLFHGDVQFKILGTFGYKQEVMHAVLVCSQVNGAGMFQAYPSVLIPAEEAEDANNEAVVTRDTNGNWEWKPQATGGTEITRLSGNFPPPKFRRWEHVAFAFHIPDDYQFNVDDPESHLHHYEL